jgi:hypothetical protein
LNKAPEKAPTVQVAKPEVVAKPETPISFADGKIDEAKLTTDQKAKYEVWKKEQESRIKQKEYELEEEKRRMYELEEHRKKVEVLNTRKVKFESMTTKVVERMTANSEQQSKV